MTRGYLLLFLLATWGFSCQTDSGTSNTRPDLLEVIPGTWEAISFSVNVNSVGDTDSSYVFNIGEKDWKPKLGIRPLRHIFKADQNYVRESRSIENEVMDLARGKWFINGDSIRLVTPEATYEYEVTIEGSVSTFHCFMDWDGDGEEDDEYTGIQRKISQYTE